MTEHDQFAMAAITGLLAGLPAEDRASGVEELSRLAYRYADALLAVRDELRSKRETEAAATVKMMRREDGLPQVLSFAPQPEPPKGKPKLEPLD